MDMLASYGHINKLNKITDFFMISVWASLFKFHCHIYHVYTHITYIGLKM